MSRVLSIPEKQKKKKRTKYTDLKPLEYYHHYYSVLRLYNQIALKPFSTSVFLFE